MNVFDNNQIKTKFFQWVFLAKRVNYWIQLVWSIHMACVINGERCNMTIERKKWRSPLSFGIRFFVLCIIIWVTFIQLILMNEWMIFFRFASSWHEKKPYDSLQTNFDLLCVVGPPLEKCRDHWEIHVHNINHWKFLSNSFNFTFK